MKSRLIALTVIGLAGLVLALIIVAGVAPSTAAQAPNLFQPKVSKDLQHDTSLPLRDLAKLAPAPAAPAAIDAINKRRPNRFDDPKFLAELKELGIDLETYVQSLWVPDAVVQNQIGVPYAPNAMPTTIHNFEGVSQDEMQAVVPGTSDDYIPPDSDGDIGYDPVTGKKYYVQYINTAYAIWDVSTLTPMRLITATGNALWVGFGGTCETSNNGDPIVLFDQLSHRWLMSQFALPGGASGFHQCIAISQSADPTGAWYRYDFLLSTTKLNDYPKFGIWPDAYYMTINQFNSSGTTYLGAGAVAFERQRMLQGLPAQMEYFDLQAVNIDFFGQLPSDLDGMTLPPAGAPNYFVEVDDDSVSPALGPDAMRIWKFHVDWTTPANSTFGVNLTPNYTLTVSPFTQECPTTRACVPQPGTTAKLDAIGDRVMFRAAYRNINGHETVVLNHTVDAGSSRAGVRWYEVRDVGSAPTIYQQSTYAPADGLHRWMGSIAMDHVGNIAVGFSGSSASAYPSVLYAGRLASDPLGVLAQGDASIITGTGSQTDSAARWGDYSAMTLDPVDDCTFWYTNEYYPVTAARDWHNRIASFKFPNCSIGPQGTLAGTVTNASNTTPIVGARVDATLSPTQTFFAYSNGGGNFQLMIPVGTYTVTGAAYGFLPASFSSIGIVSGTTTTQNISLAVAPTYVISGFVKDSVTNDPLWATLSVIGTPFNPPFASVQTVPATGFYSMTLAGGQSYTLTASALLHTDLAQGVTSVSNQTVDFNLVATTTNGGIVGWVKNYYTDNPVAGATVVVATAGNPQATTDANGYFQIFDLTPGVYTATASANLYSPVTLSDIQVLSSNVAIRTFLLPTAQLSYHPAQLHKTITFGQVITDPAGLVITNTGLGALSFQLSEPTGRSDPFGYTWITSAEPGGPSYSWIDATDGTALGLADDGAANITLPFSFPFYTSTTTLLRVGNNGGVLYNATAGDVGYANHAMTDTLTPNYFIAPFWDDISSQTGDVYWKVIGSAPNRQLVVEWYNRPHYNNIGSATFELVLFENGDILYQYQDVDFGDPAFNNGASATIGIRGADANDSLQYSYNQPIIPNNFTICFDNPNSVGACGGASHNAIPWFSESPITGTLAQSATQNIQLVWDATDPSVTQPGTYTGTLKIDNNDPAAQNTVLPVVMMVRPAASQGLLTGVVSTTGICDVNPAPIAGAKVDLIGSGGFTKTLATDAAGEYNYYVDSAQSPFTVTATTADHPVTTVGGLAVTGGGTTTQNFTLRLQKPCMLVNPTRLQATVQLGNSTSQPLFITSTGALPLNYSLFEVPSSLPTGGGPDAFGYTWITSTYSWIDATGGTALGLTDDGEANVTTPFAFPYYAGSSTAIRVGNNGAALFDATTGDIGYTNAAMASAPDDFIAPFWDDIGGGSGNVYWMTTGTAPNRRLVVEWYNRGHYALGGDVGQATFEMVLYENGNILYQYQDVDFGDSTYNYGASATVGIRGAGAANSLEYSFNTPNLHNGQAICFVRPGNPPCGASDMPWLSESITSTVGLTGTPPTGQTINVTFDASQVAQPGVYSMTLLFSHNSPQPSINVPVTLTVTPGFDVYLPLIRR